MFNRIVPWVDPFTNETLTEDNDILKSSKNIYKIINGIPIFLEKSLDEVQEQVRDSFGYKWTRSNFGQDDKIYEEKLKKYVYEFTGLEEKDLSIFDDKIILDVGVGSGSSARMWASRSKEFHGIDISKAIFKAKNALKNSVENPILSQADLNNLPYKDNTFDVLISYGVLHHTPSTKDALKNIVKKLKKGGICLFYIYKKKSPIREFSDDFIREKISTLSNDEAWKILEQITEFAKSLHQQKISVNISNDIDILGIKKGEYDLQRFFYQYFFKCFWNDEWGFEDSNMVNFDWYSPKYAWRQTETEIRKWCEEFDLQIKYIKETESGYSCQVIKN